jgi:hypothetical protein
MYVTKDKDGKPFKWSKKGKNRECEVIDNKCIVRKCFSPKDCGFVDQKTQQKNIRGMCKGLFDDMCPENYNDPKNFVTYNGRNDERDDRRDRYFRY